MFEDVIMVKSDGVISIGCDIDRVSIERVSY